MSKRAKPPETSVDRYDWSRARRGHWAGRLRTAKSVLLPADLYNQFGSDEAINEALIAVLQLRAAISPPRKRRRAA